MRSSATAVGICLALVALLGVAGPAEATIRTVATAAALDSAWRAAGSGDTILIMPGTYNLLAGIQLNVPNLTIRGATGNRDDVVLVGGGMNTRGVDEGILVNTSYQTIKDLTVKDFYFNNIHIRGENQAGNVLISNVKTWNAGERHIKVSGGGGPGAISDTVIVEKSYMLQTIDRTGHPDTGPDYIGGIDAMGIRNWIIRDNIAEGIHGQNNGGNAAIFLWQGVQNVTVERNRIIGTNKGIALGNPGAPSSGIFTYPYHAQNVLIRNNMVLRGPWTTGNNIGLELVNTKDVKVYNDTFYSADATYFRQISVQDNNGGGATANLQISDNIIRGGVFDLSTGDWTVASLQAAGNIVDNTGATVLSSWFANAALADYHLADTATGAIGSATVRADVPADYDLEARPYGLHPDKGADEWRLPGDVNLDYDVDFADYQKVEENFGKTGMTWAQGDFNRDGKVDFSDYQALESHYDQTRDPANIPEPSALAVMCGAAVGLLLKRRRHA